LIDRTDKESKLLNFFGIIPAKEESKKSYGFRIGFSATGVIFFRQKI